MGSATTKKANCFFIGGLLFCLSCVVFLSHIQLLSDCTCPLNDNNNKKEGTHTEYKRKLSTGTFEHITNHKLAVLVPYRNRFEELLQFVPHITKFLQKQRVVHHIFVLNQNDHHRFNRASLINVGFLYTNKDYDYLAMHDVDLLPLNSNLLYHYPSELGPLHIAAPQLHPKYHYENFVGGILLLRREHFQSLNGMSNKYWGWGLEDDEFFLRIRDAGLIITRPENIKTGINNTFRHIHNRHHRKRDTQKCFDQKEATRRRDSTTGLNTLKYNISGVHNISIDGYYFTFINILLECDRIQTPWCNCPES